MELRVLFSGVLAKHLLVACLFGLLSPLIYSGAGIAVASAQEPAPTKRIQFDKGKSSKTITGSVRGYDTPIYVISAKAGQSMAITLKSSNLSNYFTVTAPNAQEALFDGTMEGGSFKGRLPVSGDYQVRVFLMRNAARRSEIGRFSLAVGIK
jgi:hypothetical protein